MRALAALSAVPVLLGGLRDAGHRPRGCWTTTRCVKVPVWARRAGGIPRTYLYSSLPMTLTGKRHRPQVPANHHPSRTSDGLNLQQ